MSVTAQLLRVFQVDKQIRSLQSRLKVAEGFLGAQVKELDQIETARKTLDAQLKQVHAWLAARPNFAVMPVRHADLIRDAASQARAMNAFLGGGLDEAAMTAAVDPSLHRNRA